ncbi:ATP-dependent DNA ligase [Puerhibacterium puerhi]|uniref:ATP-dependent DNA ligase n=1 Tax=Puerhibacterium puerhi TaxID=2692623 RepID=UPI00135B5EC8|nr:ATP-dependent DNA ligase [Puerhibacterium puerhi]
MAAAQTVTVEGHRVQLTNLDKVLYPATGTTKGEVLQYYAQVAPVLLPHARQRPATRKRWPNGVEGQVFFQKNADASTPSWVRTRRIRHKSSTNDYVLVNDLATLTWLGQTATLEIHVPQWQFGRTGAAHPPDRLVLDLDPGPGVGLAECAQVARWARAVLTGMGLDPLPVTSGSKGIHLYAALDASGNAGTGGVGSADQVSAVAHELARYLEAEHPDLVVSDMKKSLRQGRVLVDWSQNNGNKTTIAPYSLRGRDHPTVAAPRTWEELDDPDLRHLTYPEVLERVERDGDLLAGLTAGHLAQLEPTPEHMARFERLEVYRAKRDPEKTPEPFGAAEPGAAPGAAPDDSDDDGDGDGDERPTFVIQEHHARRLHWDFRLEHEGVLVSWALPKGEPADPRQNHLAVQTEDHPLEYGGFEGTIPKGEYGAGEVTIWDAGTYDLEKWREGKEVIVTLHSERRGSRRLALIHTGGSDEAGWLIHRTKEQPAGAAGPDAVDAGAGTAVQENPGSPAVDVPLRPMLATLADAGEERALAADGHDGRPAWAFEMKWDGFRTLAVVEAGDGAGDEAGDEAGDGAGEGGRAGRRVRLVSRTGQDMTGTYPELQVLAGQVGDDLPVVLDGEIVALDDSGRPRFRLLQQRANIQRAADVAAARAKVAVDLMVFDVLQVGARTLVREPYDARRKVLEDVLAARAPVHLPPAFDGDLDAAMRTSRRLGLEGVVAKRRDAAYSDRRSRQWLKLKHSSAQEVVVVGWRPLHAGTHREDDHRAGSLLLAVPVDGELRYAGKVGTGFTEADRRAVAQRLHALARKTPPVEGVPRPEARHARWVTPRLVGEVEMAEWTGDPAQDPDARLRQPSWRGWREDKTPDDVVVER